MKTAMGLVLLLVFLSGCSEDRDLYKFLVKPYRDIPCDADNCGKEPR